MAALDLGILTDRSGPLFFGRSLVMWEALGLRATVAEALTGSPHAVAKCAESIKQLRLAKYG